MCEAYPVTTAGLRRRLMPAVMTVRIWPAISRSPQIRLKPNNRAVNPSRRLRCFLHQHPARRLRFRTRYPYREPMPRYEYCFMEMLGAVGRGTPEDPGSWRFPLRVRPRTDATMALRQIYLQATNGRRRAIRSEIKTA